MGDEMDVPTYAELRNRKDAPPGSSWRVFGPDDHLGTLNFLTPERIAAASGLIKRGAVFNLDYELSAFMPLHGARRPSTTSSRPTRTIGTTGSTRSTSRGRPRSMASATCAITGFGRRR